MSRSLDEILADYRGTYADIQRQKEEREAIKKGDAYQALEKQRQEIEAQQKALLDTVPDSSGEFNMDREELIKYMTENGVTRAGEFVAKTRSKSRVDTRRVLEAVGGDIDAMMLLVNVSQKAIDDFSKANPEYKHDLKQCIVDDGFAVTDVILAPAA